MPLSASMQNVSNDRLRCPVSADNNDGYDLQRFVVAQDNTYQRACEEFRQRRKRSHWIWFIFPQMKGLGVSVTSQVYGVDSLAEARAYLTHPVLGPRLILWVPGVAERLDEARALKQCDQHIRRACRACLIE